MEENKKIEKCVLQKESKVETRYILMPEHLNQHGTAFGGTILSWIDMIGAMSAQKFAKTDVVTASIDNISFQSPAQLGDHIVLRSLVTYAGKTSMEVEVLVYKENPYENTFINIVQAFLTFVAIDKDNGKKTLVPKLIVSDDNVLKYALAKERVAERKNKRENN